MIRIELPKKYKFPGDYFEQLIKKDKIKWFNKQETMKFILSIKNTWLQMVVQIMLKDFTDFQIGDVIITWKGGDNFVIKINGDPDIGFMDVYANNTNMWCNKDHSDGIHPDVALVKTLQKQHPDRKYSVVVDDKKGSIIYENGKPICIDPRTGKDRSKLMKR